MRYKFFICKPLNKWWAPHTLRQYVLDQYADIDWANHFCPFGLERISKSLQAASIEAAGSPPMFKVRQVTNFRGEALPILQITTEYHLAQKVAEELSKFLAEEGVMLFDAEMDCLDAVDDIAKREREKFVVTRLAYQRHCTALRKAFDQGLQRRDFLIYKLGECFCMNDMPIRSPVIDTSIALMRGDLEKTAKKLHATLSETAKAHGGEHVYCKDGCFVVENEATRYRLRFVLEGVGKSPMYLCWIEHGTVNRTLLHRMGIYRTRKLIEKQPAGEEEHIRSRLYFQEFFFTRAEWKNPADRFVDSYKISCKLRKNKLELIYGRHPFRTCTEFCFSEDDVNDKGWDAWKNNSKFDIYENEGLPLLALVAEVIPYYPNYYYDSFHVRKEEVVQILSLLKKIRPIIRRNPLDASLGKIAKHLLDSSFAYPPDDATDADGEKSRQECLLSRRRELNALYDFFEWWLTERKYYSGFHIIGP